MRSWNFGKYKPCKINTYEIIPDCYVFSRLEGVFWTVIGFLVVKVNAATHF